MTALPGRLSKTVGILVMLDVVAVYTYCLKVKGTYPVSHPWSGIAMILLSANLTLRPRGATGPTSWGVLALTALSAVFWSIAATQ